MFGGRYAPTGVPLDSWLITRYHFYEKRVGETLLTNHYRQISNQILNDNFNAIPRSRLLYKVCISVIIKFFDGGMDVRKKDITIAVFETLD